MATAGIIVVGNEVLSGKVEEENARFMVGELRELGVDLLRIAVIRDDVAAIAAEVRTMAPLFDFVFTSGGVGATHDDVTLEGVAQGLDLPLQRHGELEALIRSHFRGRTNDAVLRMADLPAGARLLGTAELIHPIVHVRNIFVLPGVPQFLRAKFAYLKPMLRGAPIVLRQLFLRVGEDAIADLLREALASVAGLEIGSYPRFDTDAYKVKVTIESRDRAAVDQGVAFLLARLDPADVVRVE
ncbi:MAG: competence/damage-inducible protein A [Deltaproteobacteria bacterium]|nr:competence/damage-inducible protein A [Deltaproteobacteria bacterium]